MSIDPLSGREIAADDPRRLGIKAERIAAAAEAQRRFECTGRSSARQDVCTFTTIDEVAAISHFEQADHDVELRTICNACGEPLARWNRTPGNSCLEGHPIQ